LAVRPRFPLALASVVLLTTCVSGSPEHDDTPGAAPGDFDGGEMGVDECNYAVVTRPGSSAPQRGEAWLGDDPEPVRIHLSLAGPPTSSIVVQWSTRDQSTRATTVEYAAEGGEKHTQEGLTWVYASGLGGGGPLVRVHEAHLCGLEPDTGYSYRVGGTDADGRASWSPEYSFRTAPDPSLDASAEVRLLVLGDSRSGHATLARLLQLGDAQLDPQLLLFTGDAVTRGDSEADWEAFFTAAEPLLRRVPMVFAHGNHEHNEIHYYSLMALPGDEENFSLDYGPMHLVVLNDSPAHASGMDDATRFLAGDLAAHEQAPWKLVMHHRGVWSASPVHGNAADLQRAWAPLYDAHRVDLVLNGHDHDYERSRPMRAGAVQASADAGTTYVIAGAAGAPLYRNGRGFWTAVSESTQHVILMEVRRNSLHMRTLRLDGSLLDELSLVKGKTPPEVPL
jgi:Purple acid Phosphatase, N-terminal domain/Calcineurin-like phosphoesterase